VIPQNAINYVQNERMSLSHLLNIINVHDFEIVPNSRNRPLNQ
jgi:hypothetical protein